MAGMESEELQGLFASPCPNATTPTPTPTPGGEGAGPVLALRDVNYRVQYRTGPWWTGACFRRQHVKHVLHDVTLAFPVGQLVALVGSSGSGKTSLLDVIAHRAEGSVQGVMTFEGRRCTRDLMRQRVSYVIQADRLLPNLTVRETLTYTAYLKLPGLATRERVAHTVDNVINRMGLRGVADSRVGGAVVRGVSGGEKRRVTIAVQLLKDPDILLLDEPTTGLDSFTARHLVDCLQQLARQGKLVILSIHQPRSDIAKLLDRTALMSQGHVMYYGPTNQLVPYFTALGYPCPTFSNPLDTYIDVVSVDRRDAAHRRMTSERVEELHQAYLTSDLLAETKAQVLEPGNSGSQSQSSEHNTRSLPSWFSTFSAIHSRMNLNLRRDGIALLNRCLLLPVFVPFVVMFLGRVKTNQSSIQDRIGLLYQSVQVPPYVGIVNAVALFPQLRNHFYREGLDGLYSSATFLLAYTLHILPFVVVTSGIFSTALYWSTGMNPAPAAFLSHLAVTVCLHLSGELLTVAAMGVVRNPQLANTSTALLFIASGVVASGFLRTTENVVEGLQYLSWFSVHKYSSEIVVANEFHNLNLTCDQQLTGLPCVPTGDVYLQAHFPHAVDNMHRNFQALAAFTLGFLLFAMLVFRLFGLKKLV